MSIETEALQLHKKHKGKLEIKSKVPLKTKKDLTLAYTPGVAEPCRHIAKDKSLVYEYTNRGNTVAIITDGTAVLGLGDIGPEASLPVMEGKAIIFKEMAGIDGIPIALAEKDIDMLVKIIKALEPNFGAINLEDIGAPRCMELEAKLKEELSIPVMHDDQHGTAVVTLAALINALKVVGKSLDEVRVVINGAGSAGIAIAKLLKCAGMTSDRCVPVKELIVVDLEGIIYDGRSDLNKYKQEIAQITNPHKRKGRLIEALLGADVFIGVSGPGALSRDMVRLMAKDPIVFAMANPDPEIMPQDAKKGGARIYASGRSDFENQVNNALAYPGIFRGALDAKAKEITHDMMIAAAHAIASCVPKPTEKMIVPTVFDANVVKKVAAAVAAAANKPKAIITPAKSTAQTKGTLQNDAVPKVAHQKSREVPVLVGVKSAVATKVKMANDKSSDKMNLTSAKIGSAKPTSKKSTLKTVSTPSSKTKVQSKKTDSQKTTDKSAGNKISAKKPSKPTKTGVKHSASASKNVPVKKGNTQSKFSSKNGTTSSSAKNVVSKKVVLKNIAAKKANTPSNSSAKNTGFSLLNKIKLKR